MSDTVSLLNAQIQELHKRIQELEDEVVRHRQIESVMSENENNLRIFFNTIDHLLFVLDMQGNIIFANETVYRKLGFCCDELNGQSVLAVHPPERREEAGRIVGEMLAGTMDYCPVPLITKDGRRIPVETRVVAGKWSGQDVIFGVTKDLSDIKASEEKFSKAFRSSPALMAISEVETGVYVDVNDSFLRNLEYTREEVIGKSSVGLNLFADPAQRKILIDQMKRDGYVRNAQVSVCAKSGALRHGLFSVEYIQLQDKKLLLTVMSDLTEKIKAEELLRVSEERMEMFFSQSLDGFFFMMLDEPVRWDDSVNKEKVLDYVFSHQRVTKINDAMLSQYNATREDFMGLTPNNFFSHDIEQGRRVWRQFFDAGHMHVDTDERKFDGTQMWVEGDYVCMYDAQGRIVGHFGIQRDVTDRKRAQEILANKNQELQEAAHQLEASRNVLQLVIESIPVRIFWKDKDSRYLGCNRIFARDAGLENPEDLFGKTDYELAWTAQADLYRNDDLNVMETRCPKMNIIEPQTTPAGGTIWLNTSKVPLLTPEGEVFGVLGVYEDITSRRQAEDALHKSEARYRALFEQSHDAVFIMSLEGRHLEVNRRAVELLGYTQFELLALSSWDISAELDKSADVLTRLLHGEHVPIFERLFRKKSGEVIPVEINVEIVRDADGKPMHLQSVVRDITERKCAEEVLRESEIRYRIVADNTHDWEFWQLSDGQFLYTSPSCKRITGYDAQEFMSNPDLMLAIVHPEDRDNYLKHQRRTNSNQTPGEVEFRILLPDGSIVWIGHVCQPVFDDRGNYLGARGSNRNITLSKQTEVILKQANADLRIRVQQVENLQMELREQAIRDPLTNLYNRRYLNETLERDLARMKREKKPLSVIMIDLDHFKSVNDTYGHLTGDQFLIKLAQIISNSARGSDIACRYGGEEFLLVMPGASANAAFKRAEEIRRLCARTHVLCGAEKVRVTASLGVAAFPLHGRQGSDLIAKADVALYISKANGRNKVTLCCEKQTRAAHK